MELCFAMRAFLLVLIGGAVCFNYTQSVTVSDVFWMTLVQLPTFVVLAFAYDWAKGYFAGRRGWVSTALDVVFAIFVGLTVVECFLCLFVGSGFTPAVLTFLFQTDAGESQGFVQAYLANKRFLLFVALLVLSWGLFWCVTYLLSHWSPPRTWLRLLVSACLVLVFVFPAYPCTCVSRLVLASRHYFQSRPDGNEVCSDTKVRSVGAKPDAVVVIIGEAFSKHHSSLYGYEKQTNPCLEAYVTSGNLYMFHDVVAPYNKTHMMLKELLSMHSVDSPESWNAYPLWPQIFKDAGYYVAFVSNQVPSSESRWNESYFFQNKEVEQKCFDYRNPYVYRFDEGIFNELQSISGLCDDPNELTILHLKGQHIYSTNNFPHERFTCFQPSDYLPYRFSIDSRQVQELADYDNATRYNDHVVARMMDYYSDRDAIVVYLSDHGEEVYDYRPFLGRTHEEEPTRQEIRCQYEVPFMIYMSDGYKSRHPDVAERVQGAVGRRFMSDDLPHLLLGVSGIETEWYDSRRDLLSHDFNEDRKRVYGY